MSHILKENVVDIKVSMIKVSDIKVNVVDIKYRNKSWKETQKSLILNFKIR